MGEMKILTNEIQNIPCLITIPWYLFVTNVYAVTHYAD